MIKFKLILKNNSIYSYKFDAAGLSGIFEVNVDTTKIDFIELNGAFKDNNKAKERVLYAIYAKLRKENYPEYCLFATHWLNKTTSRYRKVIDYNI